jgi:hypothetical protein
MPKKKKDDLPEEYVPKTLRKEEPTPRDKVIYAVGHRDGLATYGMTDGPFPTLEEALEVAPSDDAKNCVVLRLNKDGTDEVLYHWHVGRGGVRTWRRWKGD